MAAVLFYGLVIGGALVGAVFGIHEFLHTRPEFRPPAVKWHERIDYATQTAVALLSDTAAGATLGGFIGMVAFFLAGGAYLLVT